MVDTLVEIRDPVVSREERKRTGKQTAAILVVVFCLLGFYHAFIRQNVVLASLVVPVFIMSSYLCWVLHLAKKVERIKSDTHRTIVVDKKTNKSNDRISEKV